MYLWSLNNNSDTSKPNSIEYNKMSAVRKLNQQQPQEQKQPVHSFIGHTDVVFDIHWRQIEAAGRCIVFYERYDFQQLLQSLFN